MTVKVPTQEDHKHNTSVELSVINCGHCGGTYSINERHRMYCYEHGTGWTCPYCRCSWGYFGEHSKIASLKRQLKKAQQEKVDQAKSLANDLARLEREKSAEAERATKLKSQVGEIGKRYKRIRERVRNGVCPCCNRQFQNLLRHMRAKHPEHGDPETLRAVRGAFGLTQAALAEEVQLPAPYISAYENKKGIPAYAKEALDEWLAVKASAEFL